MEKIECSDFVLHGRSSRGIARCLQMLLPECESLFVVGGAVREHFMSRPPPLKDIDFIVSGVDLQVLENIFDVRRTWFGGYSFNFEDVRVDIWELSETYHIRRFDLPATIEGYLRGAPFNLDKIAYDLKRNILYDDGCLEGIIIKDRIVYAPEYPYLEYIQAIRCDSFQRRLGFELDQSARDLMFRVAKKFVENEEMNKKIHTYLQAHQEA